jgi:excisionase family DNA binding protein
MAIATKPEQAVLLTPDQLSKRLNVPVTWIREKTRERARVRDKDPLPVVRLGKYVRFDWDAVQEWLRRQSQ